MSYNLSQHYPLHFLQLHICGDSYTPNKNGVFDKAKLNSVDCGSYKHLMGSMINAIEANISLTNN